jgi:hypothetical protein
MTRKFTGVTVTSETYLASVVVTEVVGVIISGEKTVELYPLMSSFKGTIIKLNKQGFTYHHPTTSIPLQQEKIN